MIEQDRNELDPGKALDADVRQFEEEFGPLGDRERQVVRADFQLQDLYLGRYVAFVDQWNLVDGVNTLKRIVCFSAEDSEVFYRMLRDYSPSEGKTLETRYFEPDYAVEDNFIEFECVEPEHLDSARNGYVHNDPFNTESSSLEVGSGAEDIMSDEALLNQPAYLTVELDGHSYNISRDRELGRRAYERELPELLKDSENYGKWVAYRGLTRLGVAADDVELYSSFAAGDPESLYIDIILPE